MIKKKGIIHMLQIEEIVNVLQLHCNLSKDCYFGEKDVDEKVLYRIKDKLNYEFFSGATKMVLLFKELDRVIKIPFNGDWYSEWDDDKDEEEDQFCFYECASEECSWDYCNLEVNIWEAANKIGLGECFAKTERIGFINGYPVYAQEKCMTWSYHKTSRQYSKEKIQEVKDYFKSDSHYYCFNEYWLSDFLDYYGQEMFDKFCEFIDDRGINDLHNGNIGYAGDRPVLIDFSGFFE
jgi:hypothetical protein